MRVAVVLALCVSGYISLAYFVLPALWSHYEHQAGLRGRPMTTVTAQGIPGGPLNIGLVGSKDDVVKAWALAGWYPADAITLRSSIEIAESVLLHRQYTTLRSAISSTMVGIRILRSRSLWVAAQTHVITFGCG